MARTRARLPGDLRILDWRALNDFYEKTVALYEQQFGFLQAMVLLMVCLSVINTINMSLLERSWEFGTIRITSYNVCYTKLLRASRVSTADFACPKVETKAPA